MAYRFEYGLNFRRSITRSDGTWVNLTFNRDEKYNPFTERDIEIIHRSLENCYRKNQGFVNLLSGVGIAFVVLNNFHLSHGDIHPHINFRLHNFLEGGTSDDRVYHAYFDPNGNICSITYVTNVFTCAF